LRLRPPSSTLFPYTTLFRSVVDIGDVEHLDVGNDVVLAAEVEHFLRLPDTADDGTRNAAAPHDERAGIQRALQRIERAHDAHGRSEEHTSELQSRENLVCRL